jgi:hypothetical protein
VPVRSFIVAMEDKFENVSPENPNTTQTHGPEQNSWTMATTTIMNVDQKTVVLTALVDFLVEQHYVTADDVSEELLDQLILQKTGTWQFQSSASSSSSSSMLAEQQQQQQHHHPSAVRFATQRSSGVCTILETSHLSLGWTWESNTCFAVQLHLGSGCSAGSDSEIHNQGICRVVHSVDAISAAPSTRGFSNNNDDIIKDNAEEVLPLWVRDALQIQVILDPVECVVTDSNSSNKSNYSSIPNHLSVASLWRTVLGLDFLPKKAHADPPFTTFQVQCPSVTFVNSAGTCLGRATRLERSGTSFANVGELHWGSSSADDDSNSHSHNCNESNTESRFVATGLQLAFTLDVVFVHIHTVQQGSIFLNSWRNITPLRGVQVHWDGVQQLRIQVPPGSEWVLAQQADADAADAQKVSEPDAASQESGNCESESPGDTADPTTAPNTAAGEKPPAQSSNPVQPIARPVPIVMWAPVVKVVTEQAVLRIGDDYPVTLKGIEMSFFEEMSAAGKNESGSRSKDRGPGDSIRMMMKASTITLKSCFDVYVLEIAGIIQAEAVHALSIHVGEVISVGNAKVQKLWTALSQALPFHWTSGIYAPYATTSAFKSVYAMERTVNRVIPGKGHEELPAFGGDAETTIGTILVHYAEKFAQDIEMRDSRITRAREAVSDSVATTVVRAAFFGASVASPIGLVASVAAVGIKDGVSKAANMGKESRGGVEEDRYKFGDVSRGFAASIRKSTTEGKKNRGASSEDKYSFGDLSRGVSSSFRSNSQHYSNEYDADGDMDGDALDGGRSDSYMAKNKARYSAVAGSSVGAMVGLAVAGPIGLIAGSLAGGAATQSYMSKKQEAKAEGKKGKGLIDLLAEEENGDRYDQSVEPGQGFAPAGRPTKAAVTTATATASRESLPSQDEQARSFRLGDNLRYFTKKEEVKIDRKKGLIDLQAEEENGNKYEQTAEEMLSSPEGEGQPYRLGDNFRGMVSRGQKAAGRDEGSPYKFGDFSRGLFSSKR